MQPNWCTGHNSCINVQIYIKECFICRYKPRRYDARSGGIAFVFAELWVNVCELSSFFCRIGSGSGKVGQQNLSFLEIFVVNINASTFQLTAQTQDSRCHKNRWNRTPIRRLVGKMPWNFFAIFPKSDRAILRSRDVVLSISMPTTLQ